MEAFALGRPVVSTYIAGIPELVKPGENGWLVPAGDVMALAQAIEAVLQTPIEELERMGKKGASAVAKDHDVNHEAQFLSQLFQQQLSLKPAPTLSPATSTAS
jgi:colanic acid/amylovoran biosynthesis glycosyltransferase